MKSKSIQNAVCLFLFLLCGISFGGIRMGENHLSTLVYGLLGAACAFFVCHFVNVKKTTQKEQNQTILQKVLCIFAALFACLICAANALSFVANLEDISQKFSGVQFSHFFIIICFVFCAYAAKRGFESFSRICLIMLLPIILPYAVSWFAFIGYDTPLQAIVPSFSLAPDMKAFFYFFSICIQLTVFFSASGERGIITAKGIRYAFFAFCAVLVTESIKYFLFFWQ